MLYMVCSFLGFALKNELNRSIFFTQMTHVFNFLILPCLNYNPGFSCLNSTYKWLLLSGKPRHGLDWFWVLSLGFISVFVKQRDSKHLLYNRLLRIQQTTCFDMSNDMSDVNNSFNISSFLTKKKMKTETRTVNKKSK